VFQKNIGTYIVLTVDVICSLTSMVMPDVAECSQAFYQD